MQNSISDSGYPQRSLALPVRLGDVDPPHRLGPVTVSLQLLPQLLQQPLHPVGFNLGDGLAVDTGGAAIAAHLLPGTHEDIAPSDPVVQGVKAPLWRPLGREVELDLEVADFVFGVIGFSHALVRISFSSTTEVPSLPYRRFCCPTGQRYYAGLRLPLPCLRFRLSPYTTARCQHPDPGAGGQEGLPC